MHRSMHDDIKGEGKDRVGPGVSIHVHTHVHTLSIHANTSCNHTCLHAVSMQTQIVRNCMDTNYREGGGGLQNGRRGGACEVLPL